MRIQVAHRASLLLIVGAAVVLGTGCGTDEGATVTGGSSGTGGTAGTGGSSGDIAVVVPQCVSSAYQVVFRGLVEPLDPLLRYIDIPVDQRDASQKPPIPSLSELTDVEGVYRRFTWNVDDVPDVEDSNATFVTLNFIEGCAERDPDDPGTCISFWNLDNGIFNGQVTLVPWEMTVGASTSVGAGKLSVVGLDNNVVRITIVDFNPWYEGSGDYCRFELSSFNLHLDLATPGSEPFAVVIGFSAEGSGYSIENGSIIFGEGDTASFTGGYKLGSADPIPFDFALDYSSDPAAINGTFGGIPANCTIDLTTFAISC
jgi:hypothetical protein